VSEPLAADGLVPASPSPARPRQPAESGTVARAVAVLRAVAELTRDLGTPNPRIFWSDFLVSAFLGYAGLAIAMDSALALFLLLPCLAVVDQFVIQREERYLAAKFGADYDAYRLKVRRWL
jgi:hypothetical protein